MNTMCADCEAESRTGTGVYGDNEPCYCPCHGRGDGVAVPMPGYYTPNTCGVPALDAPFRCARGVGHSGPHESGDGLTKWVMPTGGQMSGSKAEKPMSDTPQEVVSVPVSVLRQVERALQSARVPLAADYSAKFSTWRPALEEVKAALSALREVVR
jgi:hypothetical protein